MQCGEKLLLRWLQHTNRSAAAGESSCQEANKYVCAGGESEIKGGRSSLG